MVATWHIRVLFVASKSEGLRLKLANPLNQVSSKTLQRIGNWLRESFTSLHSLGLVLGVLFFAFSMTPSLLPRPSLIQGVLSGISFSLGYGIGVTCVWAWVFLQLPMIPAGYARLLLRLVIFLSSLAMLASVWQAARWQNSIRVLMKMPEQTSVQPIALMVVSVAVFVMLLLVSRAFWYSIQLTSGKLERFLRPRAARLLALVACLWLFWAASEGIIVRFIFRTVDRSFQSLDALIDDNLPIPTSFSQTGSKDSLIAWETLGNQGRRFVSGGPTSTQLEKFFQRPCPQPIRVYVGLNSVDSVQERASLALQELIRVGGFERSTLLLVTPTGTGWVDPGSQDTVEYLLRGDVASVAVQYSYLNSPLALLTDAQFGVQMAEVLFDKIYGHWRSLPKETRPRLFLSGLSLGSLNSDRSFHMIDIVDDPIDGALWIGPPFLHQTWKQATSRRDPGSPHWLPVVRQGAVIRFMNQDGNLTDGLPEWGSIRIAFLQHASDPITFFDPASAWHRPKWMDDPRGKDVSSELRWYPVVTMLQLATDMIVGTAPPGFGHNYSPHDYLDAWVGVLGCDDWSGEDLKRLHEHFKISNSDLAN